MDIAAYTHEVELNTNEVTSLISVCELNEVPALFVLHVNDEVLLHMFQRLREDLIIVHNIEIGFLPPESERTDDDVEQMRTLLGGISLDPRLNGEQKSAVFSCITVLKTLLTRSS